MSLNVITTSAPLFSAISNIKADTVQKFEAAEIQGVHKRMVRF
jgi:hypothetical protein